MRRAVIAALSVMLAGMALPATPVHAASDAKVVVVVGPVGSSTAHYKRDANEIVDEARRHTSNVVKLYTPNATWSKVKAAAQGASVFVYLGHGNGWPSIYAPFQTLTKDGLGLDPSSGADGTKTVYYGEDYLRRDIRLAPNAVVLLYHLCYASGNTEPGLAVGPFADSRERVDNYGAGFIGAGARAVIAEGHPAHPVVNYVRQLFTTDRSMASVFRSAPTYHGNVLGPYPAQRTPGLEYLMDPDSSAPSGFYRSLIGDLSLTASQVVAPGLARTDTRPAELVVPGSAEVTAPEGAGLWAHADNAANPESTAPTTLPAGTRLRLTSEAAPAADGTRILGIKVLGGSGTGFVRSTALAPRDSEGVRIWSLDESPAWLSPNDDNVSDALVVTARFSETASAALTIKNAAGTTVKTISATDDIARLAWDLRASGSVVPDGAYTWTLRAADAWGNPPVSTTGTFTVDGTAPVTKATTEATAGADGWLISPATVTLTARDAMSGVRTISWRVNGGDASTYGQPAVVTANGAVTFEYRAIDKAGIREPWKQVALRIDTKGPTIDLAMAGKAGDLAATWRGKVTLTPTVRDATSGVATRRYSIDGAPSLPVTSDPVVVTGDGVHNVAVVATDAAGNRTRVSTTFTIDTVEPVLEVPDPGAILLVTPNGDGVADTLRLPFTVSEPGSVRAVISAADLTVVRTLTVPVAAGDQAPALVWDGRTDAGTPAPDGRYAVALTPRDAAGNAGLPVTAAVDVYGALTAVGRAPGVFFPQDGDALAPRTTASWTLLSPATVTLRVLDRDGELVRTGPLEKAYPAGAATWAWNGRDDAGAFAPRGTYRIVVTAGNGTQSATQSTTVLAEAFRVSTSVESATRGRALTVTAVTAEPLATTPRVVVRQPGLAAWTVTMTRRNATTWTATLTPKKRGTAGTLVLVVKATDTKGGANATTVRLALR